jgi:hypothetical protein
MIYLSDDQLDLVAGGGLPDEDLKQMRENNPNSDSWHDTINNPPPTKMCFESGACYDMPDAPPSLPWPGNAGGN